MVCGILGALAASLAVATHQTPLVIALAVFAVGLGLPRWVLGFLTARRKKKFTEYFAPAIDVIVRSVRSGPSHQRGAAHRGARIPQSGGQRVHQPGGKPEGRRHPGPGAQAHDGLHATPEVGFFAIVMTIQSKSGGNLSEALGNLAFVLRDRKRLQGKIKAMSSEAKASAGIIGSLPPAVMGIVWLTTPAYIEKLFITKTGNLMLAGCVVWMTVGILVMRKMINFKH